MVHSRGCFSRENQLTYISLLPRSGHQQVECSPSQVVRPSTQGNSVSIIVVLCRSSTVFEWNFEIHFFERFGIMAAGITWSFTLTYPMYHDLSLYEKHETLTPLRCGSGWLEQMALPSPMSRCTSWDAPLLHIQVRWTIAWAELYDDQLRRLESQTICLYQKDCLSFKLLCYLPGCHRVITLIV